MFFNGNATISAPVAKADPLGLRRLKSRKMSEQPLEVPPTRYTPAVILDPENCVFEFRGVSMPADAREFYGPIINWLTNYRFCDNKTSSINFYLDYFNTTSSKLLLELFLVLDKMYAKGAKVKIGWFYHEDDEELKEVGQEYAQLLRCPIELNIY